MKDKRVKEGGSTHEERGLGGKEDDSLAFGLIGYD